MTFDIFFRILISVFIAEDVVIWLRGATLLRRNSVRRGARLAFHAFLAFQTLTTAAVLMGRLFYHVRLDEGASKTLWVLLVIWHVLGAPIALVATIAGLLGEAVITIARFVSRRLALGGAGSLPPCSVPDQAPEPLAVVGAGLTRRDFLVATVTLAPPVLSLALGAVALRQLSRFRMRYLSITLPQLPRELDGMTIAHVSDTHLGRFTHGRIITDVVDATNALNADLVVFTGDLIDNKLSWLSRGIEMLKAIKAPMALCEGNHDLIDSGPEFRARVKASGLPLLVDEVMAFNIRGAPVQLLGPRWAGPSNWVNRGDESEVAHSMAHVIQLRDPRAFQILASHHPHAWDYAAGIPLTLSGHTHGGQLMINERLGIGPEMFRYWSGLYTRNAGAADMQALVVSNGVGNWFPIRTAAPAEIIHITLRAVQPELRG